MKREPKIKHGDETVINAELLDDTSKKSRWFFQEWWIQWSLWALGYWYKDGRGWNLDQLTIHIGPIRLEYVRETRVFSSIFDEDAERDAYFGLDGHR